jgi:hypothetical protein
LDWRIDQSVIMASDTLSQKPRTVMPHLVSACAADASGIAALLAQPLPGRIQLALSPSIASCTPRNSPQIRHHALVAHDVTGRVIAHGSRSVRQLWLNGKPRWIGYLGGLRREVELAGAGRRLASGLAQLSATRLNDEEDHDLTSILDDNDTARRVLEANLPGAPTYHFLGEYRTHICLSKILGNYKIPAGWAITSLRTEMINSVQQLVDKHALDYAPVVRVSESPKDWLVLCRSGEPVGCVCIIDRRTQQGVTVAGYSSGFGQLRPLINVALHLTRRPALPRAGTSLELAFVAHLCAPAGETMVVRSLLTAAAREAAIRGCHHIAIGLGRLHPHATIANKLPAWRLDSRLYAVGACPLPLTHQGPNPEAAWL